MEQPTTQTITHIDVSYYPGITVYGMLPARLELKNDRLVLTTVEGTKEAPIYKEVFNVALGEIEKVQSILDEIRVKTGGKSHRVSVAQYSTPAIAAGGVAGTALAAGMYHKSGASAFISHLRDKGITVTRLGYGKMFGLAAIAAVVLIAVALGIFFIVE